MVNMVIMLQVWLGLTDGYHGSKDEFNNINDDSVAEYYNWMDKQPDNWQKFDKAGNFLVIYVRPRSDHGVWWRQTLFETAHYGPSSFT